jgi:hypothetical protein
MLGSLRSSASTLAGLTPRASGPNRVAWRLGRSCPTRLSGNTPSAGVSVVGRIDGSAVSLHRLRRLGSLRKACPVRSVNVQIARAHSGSDCANHGRSPPNPFSKALSPHCAGSSRAAFVQRRNKLATRFSCPRPLCGPRFAASANPGSGDHCRPSATVLTGRPGQRLCLSRRAPSASRAPPWVCWAERSWVSWHARATNTLARVGQARDRFRHRRGRGMNHIDATRPPS